MSNSAAPQWKMLRLGDVASKIQDGTHFSPASSHGPFRYLTSRNVRFGYIDLTASGWVSESEHRAIYRRCDPQRGDLLLTKDGANTGNAAINTLDEQFSLLSSVAMLRFNPAEHVPGFYLQYLLSPRGQSQLKSQMSGNAITRLTLTKIKNLLVPVPLLHEQRRIAEILEAADKAILSTARFVAKLEKAKQGLLGDIFDKSHHARGGTTQWEYAPLGELLDHLIDYRGRTPRKLGMGWGGGNILALSANNVQMGGVDASREAYYGSERLYRTWMTHGPTRRGDVLITLEAPLGNVAQIPDDKKYILSQRVVLLRFAENRILNDFAYWYLRTEVFQRALVANSTGTTATGIRRARLERIVIPIPDIQAQRKIAQSVFAIQGKIDSELAVEAKLKQVRRGLMEDLLTGRVRVDASL